MSEVEGLRAKLAAEEERCRFWERTAKEAEAESRYYQQQLVDAHALLGRVIHQLSERWDTVNLTKYFPTDNLSGRRTVGNAAGEKPAARPEMAP